MAERKGPNDYETRSYRIIRELRRHYLPATTVRTNRSVISVLPWSLTQHGTCNGLEGSLTGCGKKLLDPEIRTLGIQGTGYWFHEPCALKVWIEDGTVVQSVGGIQALAPKLQAEPPTVSAIGFNRFVVDGVRTQKARGLVALAAARFGEVPPTLLVQDMPAEPQKLLDVMLASEDNPVWSRPCPTRPRHGFVESRAVTTAAQLEQVWRETRDADGDGEMLLQPMIPAEYSAILTENSLTWGPGNDGATSGTDAMSLMLGAGQLIPSAYQGSGRRHGFPKKVLDDAGLCENDSPYVELVYAKRKLAEPLFVQLRGGPAVKAARDYQPRTKFRVKQVYRLTHDAEHTSTDFMLEWERLVPQLPPGTVVWHPGGALRSHFGIHCVLSKVPYITSREPIVGETMLAERAPTTWDSDALRQGILRGAAPPESAADMTQYNSRVLLGMFTLHNSTSDMSPLGSWLLGYGASSLFKMMALACLGELRHFRSQHTSVVTRNDERANNDFWNKARKHSQNIGSSYDYNPWETLQYAEPWLAPYLDEELNYAPGYRPERTLIFNAKWSLPNAQLVQELTVATRAFLHYRWSSGVGGLLWGRCGLTALRLHEAMSHVARRPTPRAVQYLVAMANRAANQVHNNGSIFSKFSSTSTINSLARLNRNAIVAEVLPSIMALQPLLSVPAPPLGVRPRAWKGGLPRTLARYADDGTSHKRCEYWTGNGKTMMVEDTKRKAVKLIMACMIDAWRSQYKFAVLAAGTALFESWCVYDPSEYAAAYFTEHGQYPSGYYGRAEDFFCGRPECGADFCEVVGKYGLSDVQLAMYSQQEPSHPEDDEVEDEDVDPECGEDEGCGCGNC